MIRTPPAPRTPKWRVGALNDADALTAATSFCDERARTLPNSCLLSQVGIDFKKEAEAFHYAAPDDGSELYDGWFYFVGTLIDAGNRAKTERAAFESGARYWFTKDFPGHPRCFGNDVAAVEFVTRVP
jgi:hypothetical protein